ncbi:hypothetical protein CT0214 [Chlorobaculum tepidum TLS]|uniref:Uncharacterized protein n=1 Tax=Chlorobaculum tepidum (strain ATCC 49652 / DSM 12025 / NBRC 103806 / TLS) TaxID=194439 RepID=Q8KFV6_CHLTE|nr:hypothetical protein CT0214 [Chlorobaculum tepidum TLS]
MDTAINPHSLWAKTIPTIFIVFFVKYVKAYML